MLIALHLPNHTLSPETTLATTLLSVAAAVVLVRSRSANAKRGSLLLIAAVTVFVFAVQMVNFPLLDGVTSGHLLGSAVAVVLLGPAAGCAVLAAVLTLQAVLLGDGGVGALGANLLNMALISPLIAYACYVRLCRLDNGPVRKIAAAFVAGWIASVAAAVACALELAASGVGSLDTTLTALVGHHAWLGLIEGAATAVLCAAASQPVIVARRLSFAPAIAAAAIALALLPFSSELPDTLDAALEPTVPAAAD